VASRTRTHTGDAVLLVEDLVVRVLYRTVLTLAGLPLSAVIGCGGEARSASPQQAGVPRAASATSAKAEFTVDTVTVQLPLELPAQLYVEHDAVVVARSAGTIDSLFAELGDHVSAGQTLARLESGEQEIALASAQAAYDNLARAAARERALTKSGGATAADSEQVEFQLRQSEIARRKASRDLELTRIAAPFDGIVTARSARPRRFVSVGDTLFRVTEPSPLFARVRAPEGSARGLRIGDAATIVASSGGTIAAKIVHMAPFIDAASGTREVVLEVVGAPAGIPAGSSVVVRVGHEARRAISVSRDAIAAEGYVVVVDNGRTTLRPVTIGRDLGGGKVEVMSGLAPGERLARPTR
jgi:RND family efflux transporter MFP subunit